MGKATAEQIAKNAVMSRMVSSMSLPLDWWKTFFEIGGVTLLFLTFVFGAGLLIVDRRINAIQAEELRQFDLKLSEQQERAAKAELELEKLRTPRTVNHIPELIASLEAFKDTEYTFSAVSAEEESINLLKQIDAILQKAGWKRGKPIGGFPAINVFGNETNFAVPVALASGVLVSIDSSEPIEAFKARPIAELPSFARAAIVLDRSISDNLFPPQENIEAKVHVTSGVSTTVRISVGKKP